ncbi:MAG: hypothetical protein RLZZ316_704 [Bacteroidota bacterium]
MVSRFKFVKCRAGMRSKIINYFICFLLPVFTMAQNYRALHGSPYAGSLGVHNNPASILHAPYKWDLTLFGAQFKTSTNAITVVDYSLLSNPANSKYFFNNGAYKRFADQMVNFNLLNARIAIGKKKAIAFGVNIRGYNNLHTGSFNYIDTARTFGDFFKQNPNTTFQMDQVHSAMAEFYITYSQTIFDNSTARLNAGITVKGGRGISGNQLSLLNGSVSNTIVNNRPVYTVNNALLQYGYSSNYDRMPQGGTNNLANFFKYTEGAATIDGGIEFIIKPQEVADYYDDDNFYDYNWKLGLSILDAGLANFKYGTESRVASGVKAGITDIQLDNTFDSTITSLKIFNDSLAAVAGSISNIGGNHFQVINPMRVVLNADRFIYGAFFVNAELSVNIPTGFLKDYKRVNEINLLTITPRWETRKWGAYLPFSFNTNNQFWIGGAFKAGPLLIGVHNWSNVFSKKKIQNGGGYIALVLRAREDVAGKKDRRLNCPTVF